jgi:hypothetical protein
VLLVLVAVSTAAGLQSVRCTITSGNDITSPAITAVRAAAELRLRGAHHLRMEEEGEEHRTSAPEGVVARAQMALIPRNLRGASRCLTSISRACSTPPARPAAPHVRQMRDVLCSWHAGPAQLAALCAVHCGCRTRGRR